MTTDDDADPMHQVGTDSGQQTPYWIRLRKLLDERQMTLDELYLRIQGSLSRSALGAYAMEPKPPPAGTRPRWRYPATYAFEQIAQGLDIDPSEFPEYQLARAREELDERVVGMDDALRALEIFREAARSAADRGSDLPGEPHEDGRKRPAATRLEA